jgi:hypothetical protein
VERISIHHCYELVVDGTAPHVLTNTQGRLLDGANHVWLPETLIEWAREPSRSPVVRDHRDLKRLL